MPDLAFARRFQAEMQPRCQACGCFVTPSAPGVSGRLSIPANYWNGPDGEDYRCVRCTRRLGPMPPSHGATVDTAWHNRERDDG